MTFKDKYAKPAIVAILALVAYAIYYFFVRVKTPYEIAKSLGLYTGEPEHDACLNDMIAATQLVTGGNCEWELNEAKSWLSKAPTEDYWRVNNAFLPVSGFLITIDTTFDYYALSPDIERPEISQETLDTFQSMLDGTYVGWSSTYTDQMAADVLGYSLEDLQAALAFSKIPTEQQPYTQALVSSVWGRFNAYKYLIEHPEANAPNTAFQGTIFINTPPKTSYGN